MIKCGTDESQGIYSVRGASCVPGSRAHDGTLRPLPKKCYSQALLAAAVFFGLERPYERLATSRASLGSLGRDICAD